MQICGFLCLHLRKARISQLLRDRPRQGAPQSARQFLALELLKKRKPSLTSSELRQIGEASALEAMQQLQKNRPPLFARLSCQYVGVSTGPHTYASAAQALRNSTLVYLWRLTANGQERTAVVKKSARIDTIGRFVPLPQQLKGILDIETAYLRVLDMARQRFPRTTFNLRLGVPKKLEAPPHPYAAGASVMLRLPSGQRVEHVLCAHISGNLWYCHAGNPKEGVLNIIDPFNAAGLVIQSLASCWHPWQLQRKRLRGRCTKRGLEAAVMEKRSCFERVVAIAKWKAEAYRAREHGEPVCISAASAGVDFTEEALGAAAASPWTSTVFAVWQWGDTALDRDNYLDVEMRYALRWADYRSFSCAPQAVLPAWEPFAPSEPVQIQAHDFEARL